MIPAKRTLSPPREPSLAEASQALARALRAWGYPSVAAVLDADARPRAVRNTALAATAILDALRLHAAAHGQHEAATRARMWAGVAATLWAAADVRVKRGQGSLDLSVFRRALRGAQN